MQFFCVSEHIMQHRGEQAKSFQSVDQKKRNDILLHKESSHSWNPLTLD